MLPYVRLPSRRQCTTAAGNPKHFSSKFFVNFFVDTYIVGRGSA
jgi:hypothetical protein